MKPTTKLRIALLCSVLTGPIAARAQPIEGLYITGGVGGNYRQTQDFTGLSAVTNHPPNASTPITRAAPNGSIPGGGSSSGLGSIGWGFGNGFRAEVEGQLSPGQR